jgi:hypothetical protein
MSTYILNCGVLMMFRTVGIVVMMNTFATHFGNLFNACFGTGITAVTD